MGKILLVGGLDSASTRLITAHPTMYIEMDAQIVDSYIAAFGDVPGPWPFTVARVLEDAALIDGGVIGAPQDSIFDITDFEAWAKPENRMLIREVLGTSKYVDWYYANGVIIPASSDWESGKEALKVIYAEDGMWTNTAIRATVGVAEHLGWCGIQGREWQWMCVFAEKHRVAMQGFVSANSKSCYIVRGNRAGGELWLDA